VCIYPKVNAFNITNYMHDFVLRQVVTNEIRTRQRHLSYRTTVGNDSPVRSIREAHPAPTPSIETSAKPLIKLPFHSVSEKNMKVKATPMNKR
jgi:hypothetical protein